MCRRRHADSLTILQNQAPIVYSVTVGSPQSFTIYIELPSHPSLLQEQRILGLSEDHARLQFMEYVHWDIYTTVYFWLAIRWTMVALPVTQEDLAGHTATGSVL